MREGKEILYNKPWIMQRADPYVYRHTDGNYYFTASVPAYDGIVLRRSDTLAGLADAEDVEVWHKHESGIMSCHIWAPEDEFSFEAFSLDGTVFENKGRWFYIWAEKVGVGRQISNLYIAEMETPYQLKTVQVLLTTPDYDWERVGFWVNEGPAILKRNGKIYMTYSASETGVAYCIGMLTADENDDLLDPRSWHKERYPVLASDASVETYGPGHNSFTVDEEGNDILVYHARTETEIVGDPLYNPNRHTMLMKFGWKDDKPVFKFT